MSNHKKERKENGLGKMGKGAQSSREGQSEKKGSSYEQGKSSEQNRYSQDRSFDREEKERYGQEDKSERNNY